MYSITTRTDGTKAIAVAAVAAAVVLGAAYAAEADITGARARATAEMARKVGDEHRAVCQRLRYAESTPEHTDCLREMIRLKQWHDELTARANESIL